MRVPEELSPRVVVEQIQFSTVSFFPGLNLVSSASARRMPLRFTMMGFWTTRGKISAHPAINYFSMRLEVSQGW